MSGGAKAGGASAGAKPGAAAPKPGGFLQKVKEEKAKEEAADLAKAASKAESKKEQISKEERSKTSGDSLEPSKRSPNLSGRRSPALSGRRSPTSRTEVRKYSTPDPRPSHVCPRVFRCFETTNRPTKVAARNVNLPGVFHEAICYLTLDPMTLEPRSVEPISCASVFMELYVHRKTKVFVCCLQFLAKPEWRTGPKQSPPTSSPL